MASLFLKTVAGITGTLLVGSLGYFLCFVLAMFMTGSDLSAHEDRVVYFGGLGLIGTGTLGTIGLLWGLLFRRAPTR